MQLFYNPNLTQNSKTTTFDKIESRHIVRVLRKVIGDELQITNGKGLFFEAKISIASDKKCVADIFSIQEKPKTWNYYLHIAIAPTKSNDRFEWFLEKATEIGIDEITPIICQNSERKVVKEERLEKILQSAMKQSLKFNIPKLNRVTKFNDFINQNREGEYFIAHCEDGNKTVLKDSIKNTSKMTILIGPEGDFSTNEIKTALAKNITPISLGESRLRTETAAVFATSTIAIIHQ